MTSALGCKARVDALKLVICCLCAMDEFLRSTCRAALGDLLVVSTAAKPFSIHVFGDVLALMGIIYDMEMAT